MSISSEAAEILASALERDAEDHERGKFENIGMRYDDVENEILPLQDTSEPVFALALRFWEDWCDAANHEWKFHKPIEQADWPRMARLIAASLKEGILPTDQLVLEEFLPRPKVPFAMRITYWLSKLVLFLKKVRF